MTQNNFNFYRSALALDGDILLRIDVVKTELENLYHEVAYLEKSSNDLTKLRKVNERFKALSAELEMLTEVIEENCYATQRYNS